MQRCEYLRKILKTHCFQGNSHVVYNGSFFYGTPEGRLVRLDLLTEKWKDVEVPAVGDRLYSGRYNQLDLNVDDNGLWVIYGLKDLNNTIVMKVRALAALEPHVTLRCQ